MGSHVFSSGPPDDQFIIPLTPPAGATALVIRAVFHRPTTDTGDATYRLLHLRRRGVARLPFAEICELLYNAKTGIFTAAFSGFGQKKAHSQPQHLGKVAGQDIPVVMTIPLPGAPTMTASIAVGGLSGSAVPDLAVMQKQDNSGPVWGVGDELELVLGFEGPGDLKAPAGWTMTWADDGSAIEWVGAKAPAPPIQQPPAPPTQPPVLPPAQPPVQPQGPIDPQVGPTPPSSPPVAPPPGTDPRAAAISLALQLLLPQLPAGEAAALQPIIAAVALGAPLDRNTLLLALLPLLLGATK